MTRTVCEECGRYRASHRDWHITEPGEEPPDAPPEGLCWGGDCARNAEPPIPRLRVERWLRRWHSVPVNVRADVPGVLSAILAGEEPPE